MSFRHFSNVVIVGVTMILLSRIILAQSNIEVTTTTTIVIPVEIRNSDARMEGVRLAALSRELQQDVPPDVPPDVLTDVLTETIARFNEEDRKQREQLEIWRNAANNEISNEMNSVLDEIQKSNDYDSSRVRVIGIMIGKILVFMITIMFSVGMWCYRRKCKCCVNRRSDDPLLLTDEDANDGVISIRTSK